MSFYQPKITVCKNCKDRQVGCHGHCEKYINERNQYETIKKEIHAAKSKDKGFDDYAAKRAQKRKARYK